MFRDLRQFISLLEREADLLSVAMELSPDQEIAAAVREVEEKTGRALYLPRVKGYSYSMIGNLLGHRRRIALAFGNPQDLMAVYGERRKRVIPPVRVKDGPVQEVAHRGDIDLPRLLPALIHHEGDAAPYLTSAIAVARDPESGRLSCGIHRVQLKGGNKIGILLNNPPIAAFFRRAEELSRPLPIALIVGCDPLTFISSVIRAPQEEKFAVGGGLASRPLEMVRCPGSDLEVPAHAEFVLLGELLPGIRESEGPFGESSGYYMTFESPVGRISSVIHRRDAIYHALVPFSGEDSSLIEFLWEAENLPLLRQRFPWLARIHFPPRTLGLTVLVAVKPVPHEEVRGLVHALWEMIPIAKNVVVVDEDVSFENDGDWWWVLSTRFRAAHGLWLEEGGRGMSIDPSAQGASVTRLAIDATVAAEGGDRYHRVKADRSVRERVSGLLMSYF